METMRAYTHESAGLPTQVLKLSHIPRPSITSPTQVLVRVVHCALNPAGSIVMQLLPFLFRGSPAIPEMDFSGTVVETGSSVPSHRALQPGTPVFGSAPLSQHVKSTCGALAEYIVVDHSAIVLVPQNADLHEVAGLGIAGATALEVLRASRLKSGDAVLVNGASGGIGHLVLQMCMERVGPSGKVVAICSGKHVDWIHALTPNVQIINRDQEPIIPTLVDGFADVRFDAVLDCVGIQAMFYACPAFLKQGKPYVTVGPRAERYTFFGMLGTLGTMASNMLWPMILGGTPREYVQVAAASNPAALEELADMVAEKKLKVYMGLRAVWDDVLIAYEGMLGGHAGGKIVVEVWTASI